MAIALAALAAGACGQGDKQSGAPGDSARNLVLLPSDSTTQPMGDTGMAPAPAAAGAPAPAPAPAARTQTTTRTKAAPPRAAAPTSYTATVGTHVSLAVTDTISSRTAKAGQEFRARVTRDVMDAGGHVVIPAGSVVTGSIVEVKPGGANSAGTLKLAVTSVTVHGTTQPLNATIESAGTIRQGRGVTRQEAMKVGVGAVAGAVAGRILGKDTKGAVIGGVVGAAAGAGVAAATRDVDTVLPAGGAVEIVLTRPVTAPAR